MIDNIIHNKQFLAIAKELKTNPKKWKVLGAGSFGTAYDIGKGRACKITTSAREIRAARKLMSSDKRCSGLYKILNVFTIKEYVWGCRETFGLIITPVYQKLSRKEKRELDTILWAVYGFSRAKKKIITAEIKKQIMSVMSLGGQKQRARMRVLKKYNLYRMVKDLRSLGLKYFDLHSNNILKNKKTYIHIDIAA